MIFTPWFSHCSLVYFLLILVTTVFAMLTSLNVFMIFLKKVMREKVKTLAVFLQKIAILPPENLFYCIIISNLAKYIKIVFHYLYVLLYWDLEAFTVHWDICLFDKYFSKKICKKLQFFPYFLSIRPPGWYSRPL